MEIKSVKIGNITTDNNVFLAPMASFTDFAFRGICAKLGAGLTFTELVSAKGIIYKSPNTQILLRKAEEEKIRAVQLFGSDPSVVYDAILSEDISPFDIVDINMGCPVPKVYKNGEGSALLKDILKAESVVKAAVKTGKPITCKIRIGISENEPYITEEYAKMIESAGAKMLTVHGRTREKYYSGEVHFEEIEKAKNAVSIPVIANGGIFTVEDANEIIRKTGADGVMLARGACQNPFLFNEILGTTPYCDIISLIREHFSRMLTGYSDRYVTLNMRKFFGGYFKGKRNAKELCKMLYACENTADTLKTLEENLHIIL